MGEEKQLSEVDCGRESLLEGEKEDDSSYPLLPPQPNHLLFH